LMHQGRGAERLPGLFLSQLGRRQLAQLVVDQREKLLGGVRIALLDGGQDAVHFTHRRLRGWSAKKPAWRNARRHSTTPAYSLTGPPTGAGCPSSSHPTTAITYSKYPIKS